MCMQPEKTSGTIKQQLAAIAPTLEQLNKKKNDLHSFLLAFSIFGMQINSYVKALSWFLCFAETKSC